MTRRLPVILLMLGLTACGAPTSPVPSLVLQPSLTSTPAPSPMLEPGTTATISPLTLATPAVVLEPAELPPTPTLAGLTLDMPAESLALLQPGPNSQVVSPIQMDSVRRQTARSNSESAADWRAASPMPPACGRF